jgi:hypothetical protein
MHRLSCARPLTLNWAVISVLLLGGVFLAGCSRDLRTVNLEPLLIQAGDFPVQDSVKQAWAISRKQMERRFSPPPLKGARQTFGSNDVSKSKIDGDVEVFLFETNEEVKQTYAELESKLLKEDAELRDRSRIAWNFQLQTETSVGETGVLETATYPIPHGAENNEILEYGFAKVLFRRCRAIAKVRLRHTHHRPEGEPSGSSARVSRVGAELARTKLVAYAKRLDARLQQAICP